MPFLTELDSRAEVKGSRDPLGLMAIWSHFGREVVGNLTTVSSSVRGFTTLLAGLYYAEELQEGAREERPSALETFLKFEQLAGYARVKAYGSEGVRGSIRIRARLNAGKRIRISAATDDQILSNQKVYGLWGLYSTPARSSGLLVPGEHRLTLEARAFVERHYVPVLGKRVLDLLKRPAFDFDAGDPELARALGKVHGSLKDAERAFYRDHLAWGGEGDTTHGKQRLLSEIVATHEGEEFGHHAFRIVRNRVAKRKDGEALLRSLDRIDALERLINPARIVFGYLLTQNGQSLREVAKRVASTWRRPPELSRDCLESMRGDIAAASWDESAKRWLDLADLLINADYPRFLETLIEANMDVMQKRNGSAAWLTVDSGLLRVRMADETEELRPVTEVEEMWRSTFFINSLWAISREVTGR